MIGSAASSSLRVLSPEEIERILVGHRLYMETERRQGRRADFGSADLSGLNFSGLNLRRVKMDHALLNGADSCRPSIPRVSKRPYNKRRPEASRLAA